MLTIVVVSGDVSLNMLDYRLLKSEPVGSAVVVLAVEWAVVAAVVVGKRSPSIGSGVVEVQMAARIEASGGVI